MERFIDIEDTPFGRLCGRDCVFLDKMEFDDRNDLTFTGEINGSLASKIRDGRMIPYRLTFFGVVSFSAKGIDDYTESAEDPPWCCFFTVEDAGCTEHTRFRLLTYDYAFDISARGFQFGTAQNAFK